MHFILKIDDKKGIGNKRGKYQSLISGYGYVFIIRLQKLFCKMGGGRTPDYSRRYRIVPDYEGDVDDEKVSKVSSERDENADLLYYRWMGCRHGGA